MKTNYNSKIPQFLNSRKTWEQLLEGLSILKNSFNRFTFPHEKILCAQSPRRDFAEIQAICHQMARYCHSAEVDDAELVKLLKQLVPEYQATTPHHKQPECRVD